MTSLLTTAIVKSVIALHLLATPATVPSVDKPTTPESFEASAYVNKERKIRLSIDKSAVEAMTVNLRPVGKTAAVFTERVGRKETKARLLLNVDQLPDGLYELELRTASGQLTRRIDLKTPVEATAPQRLLTIR